LRIQVVHGHPLNDSYNAALFQRITDTLRAGGHQVFATDLYREKFGPTLSPAERRSYFDLPYDDSAVASYTETLRSADGIVFCFPHWWFSMPAIVKGYFDRVWGPGIAFAHDQAGGRIVPKLTNIKLFGVVTSYGSPWWLVKFYAGDPGRKVLMRGLRPMCHPKAETFYLTHYDMDRSTAETRAAFLEKVAARLRRI
jgi:NAD(P)H dehydrogenase (quinone)